MLVLSRKTGETIRINDNIAITIIETRDGRCRVGIDAPKDVMVHRQEVYDDIQRENRRAAG